MFTGVFRTRVASRGGAFLGRPRAASSRVSPVQVWRTRRSSCATLGNARFTGRVSRLSRQSLRHQGEACRTAIAVERYSASEKIQWAHARRARHPVYAHPDPRGKKAWRLLTRLWRRGATRRERPPPRRNSSAVTHFTAQDREWGEGHLYAVYRETRNPLHPFMLHNVEFCLVFHL